MSLWKPCNVPEAETEIDSIATANDTTYCLPPYSHLCCPCFKWCNVDGSMYKEAITNAYSEVVHWKRNIFKVPLGRAGKSFVHELFHLFKAYAEGNSLELIALTDAMTLPSLLLQKPHRSSKAKEHVQCLERHLKLWEEGDLEGLLQGPTIQQHLLRSLKAQGVNNNVHAPLQS